MDKKFLYLFSEGRGSMRELLGGKGANLAEMTELGMPVPYGFTLTTEACVQYYKDRKTIAPEIVDEIFNYLAKLEELSGKEFGNPNNPLLVSVRSGARASMPGMMDTILNLGMNDQVVEGLAKLTNDERFAYDTYRRFILMYSDVVAEVPRTEFEKILVSKKKEKNVQNDTELTGEDLKDIVAQYKKCYRQHLGQEFPANPKEQLLEACKAVFRSWDNPRAVYYRRANGIPSSWGTAVNVQMMVFGNMGDDCGTGVAFTRNPSTGENIFYGEFLSNAQGEDVVAGIRTPQDISELKKVMPEVYEQFYNIAMRLEAHYADMQDMEFTIERGKLYMLQTRSGKRTSAAALKIACDLVEEGKITKEQAVMLVDPKYLDSMLHNQFDNKALKDAKHLSCALPASPGAACGQVVFSAQTSKQWAKDGKKVVLVRNETTPEDIEGMHSAQGILTARGGMTSHAAVVARGMGICCVASCTDLIIHEDQGFCTIGETTIHEGDYISMDGSTGNVYLGVLPTVQATMPKDYHTLMGWADEFRTLGVRANADTKEDAAQSLEFGAEGIGLVRTEHMFFEKSKIKYMRRLILARDEEQRRKALDKIHVLQRVDFEDIFEAMNGLPVTVRYLDPPLHEFLPKNAQDIEELANEMNISVYRLTKTIDSLKEVNPMMGHRGCRLAISIPKLAVVQTRAIIEAAITVTKRHPDWSFVPELMIPLIVDINELEYLKKIITDTADEIISLSGSELKYSVGTMLETPRSALIADQIAERSGFFSFGTNDMTQLGYGLSRDDAAGFLSSYYDKKILEFDPFQSLDQEGVGGLLEIAIEKANRAKPGLKTGICGEHGGDPASIEYFHKIGITYVSCSPFRMPIARLAAAQAAIKFPKK